MCDIGYFYSSILASNILCGIFLLSNTPSRSKYFAILFLCLIGFTTYSYVRLYLNCDLGMEGILTGTVNSVFIAITVLNTACLFFSLEEATC